MKHTSLIIAGPRRWPAPRNNAEMIGDQLRCLFLFYVNPRKAASAVLDHGKLLFAVLAAVMVTLAIGTAARPMIDAEQSALVQLPNSPEQLDAYREASVRASNLVGRRYFATEVKSLLLLAVVFVPICILILVAWDHLGGGLTILFRDYAPVLAGLLMAWAAAHLPLAIVWWSPLMHSSLAVPLQLAGIVYFLLLAAPVLSTVTGADLSHAAVTGFLGAFASAVASLFFANSGNLLYMFASPWILYYAYQRFGGDIRSLGGGLSERQEFKRHLELATINPRDADAHYQLGLLYVQRRLPAEAEERFRRALEIDPNEPDVLFQLGRLLRQQDGRVEEARQYLEKGARLNPKLSSHEVWRELGAVDLAAGHVDAALDHLTRYIAIREYDPEGLVHYGRALRAANRKPEAKTAFERAIEAARGAPKFRRAELSRWEVQARQELRGL